MVAHRLTHKLKLLFTALSVCLGLLGFITIPVMASGISQGYQTQDDSLRVGMAAALSSQSSEQSRLVEPVTQTNSDKFVGVITTVEDNLVNLSDEVAEVLVSTAGQVPVLASDMNGSVARGDYLSVSPLKGVLMKASPGGSSRVVAIALQNLDEATTEEKQITTSTGNRTVRVGKMMAELSNNATSTQAEEGSFLVVAGESLTGKAVNQYQVIAALVIFAIILIVEGSIIYGAIHSTMSALGRNPLAKKAVFKQLLQVSWIAVMVLVVGFGAIYLILWI